jgi:centromeric protein E
MIYEFNFCSSGIKCHDVDVPAIEILEVMGTVTENCDILGMRNSQLISYIDPIHPEIGI